jgi:hypothetical protein
MKKLNNKWKEATRHNYIIQFITETIQKLETERTVAIEYGDVQGVRETRILLKVLKNPNVRESMLSIADKT